MRPQSEWDNRFLNMAELVASWSVCKRSHCAAVIVKNNNTISTGYNGAPAYQPNCEDMGSCFRNENNVKSGTSPELCRAAGCHGEANAIALAAKHGHATKDATMYIYGNMEICTQCRGQIANAGIIRVVYRTKTGVVLEQDVREWTVHPVDRKA